MEENKKEKVLEENKEKTIKQSEEDKEKNVKDKKIEENDAKFKKVEVNNEKEKKKHIVLKTILIVIGILVILYAIIALRNYYALLDILAKAGKYENIENYSYEVKSIWDDSEVQYKYTKKDGYGRMDTDNKTTPENSMIAWQNYDSGESIIAFPKHNKATISENGDSMSLNGNLPFQFSTISEGMSGLGLITFITSQNYNDKECYVINFMLQDYKIWIEKDTGLMVKQDDGISILEITNVETENIQDVNKPDLTGYEISEK